MAGRALSACPTSSSPTPPRWRGGSLRHDRARADARAAARAHRLGSPAPRLAGRRARELREQMRERRRAPVLSPHAATARAQARGIERRPRALPRVRGARAAARSSPASSSWLRLRGGGARGWGRSSSGTGRPAARADRPRRRRGRRRPRRRPRLQELARLPGGALGIGPPAPGRAVHARCAPAARPRPVAGVYQGLRRELKPRGIVAEGEQEALGVGAVIDTDVRPPDELEEVLAHAEAAACELAERMRAGDLEPTPDSCGAPRCLRLPRDLQERRMIALTPQQREAVEDRTGSLLLAATAGSGKTRVLVERFVGAVLDDRVEVADVLAITFTEKAASELRDRIRAELEARGAVAEARATATAHVSTIHGFCARVLRAHALRAGLDPEFTVLQERDAARLARVAFERALEDRLAAAGETAARRRRGLRALRRSRDDRRGARVAAKPRRRVARPAAPATVRPRRCACRGARGRGRVRRGARRRREPRGDRHEDALQARRLPRAGRPPGPGSDPAGGRPARARAQRRRGGRTRHARRRALARSLRALAAGVRGQPRGRGARRPARAPARVRRALPRSQASSARRSTSPTSSYWPATCCATTPACARPTRDRFAPIMVDEFQDTNPLQLEHHRPARPRQPVRGRATSSSRSTASATRTVGLFRDRRVRARRRPGGPGAERELPLRRRAAATRSTTRSAGVFGERFLPLAAGDVRNGAASEPPVEILVDRQGRRVGERRARRGPALEGRLAPGRGAAARPARCASSSTRASPRARSSCCSAPPPTWACSSARSRTGPAHAT